ncbi:MAG TPA: ABC transporter permease subunit [Pseudothermotoga sp.]|nr:ABC transporter permease subunit [Pseudothermotoga sp.]HOK83882.1 ABC transporter permease subunit [Pseudothermotoga sp.]HPP70217.1 ABC transporter permease subunit [Pseudothermotoga sp.]
MKKIGETLFKSIVFTAAILVAAALFGIIFFLFSESLRAMKEIGWDLFSTEWFPVWEKPDFGIRTMLLNSIILTLWTSFVVFSIGIIVALYLHSYANKREKELMLRVLEYVSGIPSVVLGFFGIVIVAPILLKAGAWTGQNFFNASFMLSVLTLPFMISLSYQSLEKVPKEISEAAVSIGARDFAVMIVELRYAMPGIVNAMMSVFNRIFGETMIVLMVAGGSNLLVRSFFDPIRPLTATLGSELGEVEVKSLHYSALFFIGFLLLAISLAITLLTNYIVRWRERWIRG